MFTVSVVFCLTFTFFSEMPNVSKLQGCKKRILEEGLKAHGESRFIVPGRISRGIRFKGDPNGFL